MLFAVVYFAFKKDQDLLTESLKGIERLKIKYPNDIIDIQVYDDAKCPLDSIPDNIIYKTTNFDRSNNLNGYECVKGMISCYEEVMSFKNYDWILKTDCDTIINHLNWVHNLNPDIYAEAGTCGSKTADYCWGHCHAYSRARNKLL